jgi:hypothetical protein
MLSHAHSIKGSGSIKVNLYMPDLFGISSNCIRLYNAK